MIKTTSAYSENLVTVTLFPCPEGVTVSGEICKGNMNKVVNVYHDC